MYSDTASETQGLNLTCPSRSQPKRLAIRKRNVVCQKKTKIASDLPHQLLLDHQWYHLAANSHKATQREATWKPQNVVPIAFSHRDQDTARGVRLAEASADSPISQQQNNSTPLNVYTQSLSWHFAGWHSAGSLYALQSNVATYLLCMCHFSLTLWGRASQTNVFH